LSAPEYGDKIKVWLNPTKGTEVSLPKTWNLTTDTLPSVLYVEGVVTSETKGDVVLTLAWSVGSCDDTVKVTVVSVDLDIYHGQSGAMLLEGKEDDKHGAVTVANLNDTDGDGRADKDDDYVMEAEVALSAAAAKDATAITVGSVVGYAAGDQIGIRRQDNSSGELRTIQSINANTITLTEGLGQAYAINDRVYHPGENERDLMALTLRKPSPALGGDVTLTVTGAAKIWVYALKWTPVELTNNKKVWAMADLLATGTTVWVEATEASSSLRDIELEWEYKGLKDIVKATALWVEKTTDRQAPATNTPWRDRQAANGWPDNPVVGAGGQLTDLNEAVLVNNINTTCKAVDGSRYGHGGCTAVNGANTYFGGRIFWEFRLVPAGAEALDNVKLDVTRQVFGRWWWIAPGKLIQVL